MTDHNLSLVENRETAAEHFTELFESKSYFHLKQTERFLKQAKLSLREMLEPHEAKRHEFKNINWVAKFVAKKVWKTNHQRLIENLFCYVNPEIALSVINLDQKLITADKNLSLLDDFILPAEYYIRPTLNKNGKSILADQQYEYLFGGQSEEELVAEIREFSIKHKQYEERYEAFKASAMCCAELKQDKKVSTRYGSVSLIKKATEWDMMSVYANYGEEFFLTYGKVNAAKLDELILVGAIPKTILSAHRILQDIRLDFVVMDLDSEEKAMNFHRNKQMKASLKRFA